MFSKRALSMKPSPIRKFAKHSEQAKKMGKTVIPLNIGQPDIPTPKVFLDAVSKIDTDVIAYAPSDGIPVLKKSFSDYFKKNGLPFEEDDILVTNGGSEALLFLFMLLCDEGDEILVFEPFYSNYVSISQQAGAVLTAAETDPDNNYSLPSAARIIEKAGSRTKCILVTNPSNPTGHVLRRSEMDAIVEAALEKDLFIISDEVYREFTYDGIEYISFTEYPQIADRLVIVDSISKRFSGCGIRIGCIASKNEELMAHALKMCQARLAVPYVEQVGAAALFAADDSIIFEAADEYSKRRDVCIDVLSGMEEINFKKPEGAFYFILRLPVEDADDFTGWLLTDFDIDGETIMMCPADGCYTDPQKGKNEVRISYCIDSDRLRRGMNILQKGIREYNRQKKQA